MTYDFDDILIVPADITNINSRSEVNPYYGSKLPLFAAPMDTVVNRSNIQSFVDAGVKACLPRESTITPHHYSLNEDIFYSYSLTDFRSIFLGEDHIKGEKFYALIDVANGHMPAVRDAVLESKKIYGERLQLMVGNIANPDTYTILSQAGADYIRVGIGNGGCCLTTQQTGVGYPMASLIKECYDKSLNLTNPAKIVADGGMKKYSDIIKALALGADYVMLGSIFNKALESAGENYVLDNNNYLPVSEYNTESMIHLMNQGVLYKKYRGMSTKEVQKFWGNKKIKTSEGIVKYQKVEYTIPGWCENFQHYLCSAMSYTNSKTLCDFIGCVKTIQISTNALNRFNK